MTRRFARTTPVALSISMLALNTVGIAALMGRAADAAPAAPPPPAAARP